MVMPLSSVPFVGTAAISGACGSILFRVLRLIPNTNDSSLGTLSSGMVRTIEGLTRAELRLAL